MDENIYQIAEQIVQLHQKAYEVYLPLVEDVCSRTVSEDELSHLLDYLLDFACDEKMLGLYKRVCRKYLDVYPGCIKNYIEAYREMWEDEDSYSVDYLLKGKRYSVSKCYDLIMGGTMGKIIKDTIHAAGVDIGIYTTGF